MKVLLDTNILLDALADRQPWAEDACKIIRLVAQEKIDGYITANSLTDIHYLIRKHRSESVAREALDNILQVFKLIDLLGSDCQKALDLSMPDYEDALALTLAGKAGVDFIVTRDLAFIAHGMVPETLQPGDFLEKTELRGIPGH
ncbi:MAG TPA: PIN domain-containing protein [Bacillota bacterium]|nr:PIN domain-containing protein [Fastidiosipila sp.]HPX92820.1 PIN domain-containing protein [Bacillota bacterium]HQB81305.1 PIN domain-containing protein [Bacillota bacterium]